MLNCYAVEEIGVIKSIHGVTAKVSIPRTKTCEGCTAGICVQDKESMEIEAFNQVDAHVGQKVRVVIDPSTYLKGSIVVYGVPAIALVIGAVLGKEVFSHYFYKLDPDIVSAVFGFGLLIIAFLFVKLWSRRFEKKVNTKPIIEEILE
jgi:sigma-E factor negative regulatory protein RseC